MLKKNLCSLIISSFFLIVPFFNLVGPPKAYQAKTSELPRSKSASPANSGDGFLPLTLSASSVLGVSSCDFTDYVEMKERRERRSEAKKKEARLASSSSLPRLHNPVVVHKNKELMTPEEFVADAYNRLCRCRDQITMFFETDLKTKCKYNQEDVDFWLDFVSNVQWMNSTYFKTFKEAFLAYALKCKQANNIAKFKAAYGRFFEVLFALVGPGEGGSSNLSKLTLVWSKNIPESGVFIGNIFGYTIPCAVNEFLGETVVKEGFVHDLECFEGLLKNCLKDCLECLPEEHVLSWSNAFEAKKDAVLVKAALCGMTSGTFSYWKDDVDFPCVPSANPGGFESSSSAKPREIVMYPGSFHSSLRRRAVSEGSTSECCSPTASLASSPRCQSTSRPTTSCGQAMVLKKDSPVSPSGCRPMISKEALAPVVGKSLPLTTNWVDTAPLLCDVVDRVVEYVDKGACLKRFSSYKDDWRKDFPCFIDGDHAYFLLLSELPTLIKKNQFLILGKGR